MSTASGPAPRRGARQPAAWFADLRVATDGAGAVARREAALAAIDRQVTRVDGPLQAVATGGVQQRERVAQIAGAVDQRNGTTQPTAANAEERAAAATELSAWSARLQELAGAFTGDAEAHAAAGPREDSAARRPNAWGREHHGRRARGWRDVSPAAPARGGVLAA